MEWIKSRSKTKLSTGNPRKQFPIYGKLPWARPYKSHNNTESNNYKFSHRHGFNVYTISTLVLSLVSPTAAIASDVGGISATANPIANSSGSVTNQAIQVLQGPYITNTYGNGIQCQGPTMNVTPFLTGNIAVKRPYEDTWMDPVYNNVDANNDDVPDNPGEILYYKPVSYTHLTLPTIYSV